MPHNVCNHALDIFKADVENEEKVRLREVLSQTQVLSVPAYILHFQHGQYVQSD